MVPRRRASSTSTGARAFLEFEDDTTAADSLRERLWTRTGGCFERQPGRLAGRSGRCRDARFEIRSETTRMDRVYPPVLPMANGGALVFLAGILIGSS